MAPKKKNQGHNKEHSHDHHASAEPSAPIPIVVPEELPEPKKLYNEVHPHMALHLQNMPDDIAPMFQYRWLKEAICEDLDSQQRQLLRTQRIARVYLNHDNIVVTPKIAPQYKQMEAKKNEYALAEERYRKGVVENQLLQMYKAYGVDFKEPAFSCDIARRAPPYKGSYALHVLPWRSGPGENKVDDFQVMKRRLDGELMPHEMVEKIDSYATTPHAMWRQQRFLTPNGFTYKEVKERARAAQYKTMLAIPKKIGLSGYEDNIGDGRTVSDSGSKRNSQDDSDSQHSEKQKAGAKPKAKDKKSKENDNKSKDAGKKSKHPNDKAKDHGNKSKEHGNKSKEHVNKSKDHEKSKTKVSKGDSEGMVSPHKKKSVSLGSIKVLEEDDKWLKMMPRWGITGTRLVSHFNPDSHARLFDEDEEEHKISPRHSQGTLSPDESAVQHIPKSVPLFKLDEQYLDDLVANSIKARTKLKPIMTPQEAGTFWMNPREDPRFAKYCMKAPKGIMKVRKAEPQHETVPAALPTSSVENDKSAPAKKGDNSKSETSKDHHDSGNKLSKKKR